MNSRRVVKVENTFSNSVPTTKGLKQRCNLYPTLFKIDLQKVLNNWSRNIAGMGIKISKHCLTTLLFSNDQVIVASEAMDAGYMLRELIEEYQKWGLNMSMATHN